MDGGFRQIGGDPAFPQSHMLHGFVVGEHGHHRIAAAGIRDAQSFMRAACDQILRFARRTVIDRNLMPGVQKI